MSIDINNYEAYFLDYHEGKLGPHEVAELMLFLERNPELKEVFEEFENMSIMEMESGEVVFEGKEELKKKLAVNKDNYEQYFVSAIEGDLNSLEQKQVKLFIGSNPAMQREMELFRLTKLIPDNTVVYEGKNELKRGKRRPVLWYYAAAAAAALLIGLFFMMNDTGKAPQEFVNNGNPADNSSQPEVVKENDQPPVQDNSNTLANTAPSVEQKIVKKNKRVIAPQDTNKQEQKISPLQDDLNDLQSPVMANNQTTGIDSAPADKEYVAEYREEINERFDPATDDAVASNKDAGQEYNTLRDVAVSRLKTGLLKEEAVANSSPNKFSRWDFLAVALRSFRKATGKKTEIRKEYDDKGEMIAYGFSAGDFGFSRTRSK